MFNYKASVIVVNYNGADFLKKLLESLNSQTFKNFELIFVDNASSDSSLKIIDNFRRKVSFDILIAENTENVGFCEGNNVGFKLSHGEYIVLLNNDTFVHPDWLQQLIKVAEENEKTGIVQSKIYSFEGIIQTVGFMLDKYGESFSIPATNERRDYYKLFFSSGASLLVKREVLENIGLFDKELFTYHDDVDLCWRARLGGYKIAYAPLSICFHKGGCYSLYRHPQGKCHKLAHIAFYHFRNRIRVLAKNYSTLYVLRRVPIAAALICINALYSSIKFECPYFVLSLIKALIWNLKKLSDLLIQRKRVQKRRTVSDNKIEDHMLPWPVIVLRAHRRLSAP